jgi:predicted RNase H-like HicB family nuclease
MDDVLISSTPSKETLSVAQANFCSDINRICFFSQLDPEVKKWLFELEDSGRLVVALKAFRAIDQQMKIGADVREVVGQVLREIKNDFGDVKDGMDKSVKQYLESMVEQTLKGRVETEKFVKQSIEQQTGFLVEKVELLLKQGKSIEEVQKALKEDTEKFVKSLITTQMETVVDKIETLLKQEKSIEQIQKEMKEDTKQFVKETVEGQVKTLVEKVELLLNQGKSVEEIKIELKTALGEIQTATGGINTVLQTLKIPLIKGDKAEIELISQINEAFLANKNVRVEPIGGPDATDVIVKFSCQDLEVGRVLVESKSSDTWSNNYLEQVKNDMQRYGIATAILSVGKPPRGAKVKGYTIDESLGIIVITTPDMAASTLAMLYDIYLANWRIGKKTLNLQAITDDKDILCHIEDNMKCLEDCKKVNDSIDKSQREIHKLTAGIIGRITDNNQSIARLISQHQQSASRENTGLT